MENLRIAVLGARPESGYRPATIGYYHAREFSYAGADVVAVSNRSIDSARFAVNKLNEKFGINAVPHSNLERMLDEVKPDAVVVATPSATHYNYVKTALEHGCDVLCEKPVYWDIRNGPEKNLAQASNLFGIAQKEQRILAVNTQLVYMFDVYMEKYRTTYSNLSTSEFTFEILTHGKKSGTWIPADLLPHALSPLLRLSPSVRILAESIKSFMRGDLTGIYFDALVGEKLISALILMGTNDSRKVLKFGLDNLYVTSTMQRGPNNPDRVSYLLEGNNGTPRIEVEDPLAASVRRFCDAVKARDASKLLVANDESQANIALQTMIMRHLTDSISKKS